MEFRLDLVKFTWNWSIYCNVISGIVDTDNEEINNKNLRYSAYRSLYIWLWLVINLKWVNSLFLERKKLIPAKVKEVIQSGLLYPAVLWSKLTFQSILYSLLSASSVKEKYPDTSYTGFVAKSPIFHSKRLRIKKT